MTLDEQDIVNNIPVSDLLQNISARLFSLPNDLPPLEKGTEFVSINVLTDRGEIACYQHCHGENCWRDYAYC